MTNAILSSNPTPLPLGDRLVNTKRQRFIDQKRDDPLEGLITPVWAEAMGQQSATIAASPARLATAEKRDQAASIAATDMSGGILVAGFYRVTWYVTIAQAAGVSSSVTVTVDFTDRGVSKTHSYPAVTGNTTSTYDQGGGVIRSDATSPIRYSTTYASVGVPAATYDLVVILERMSA